MMLLCDRPHEKNVDFDTARFVVGKACGINVRGQRLERGDLVPEGVLNATALRELYDTPSALIETLEHGLSDPSLVEAFKSRNPELDVEDGILIPMASGGLVPAQEPLPVVGETNLESTVPKSWAQEILAKPDSGKIDPKAEVERLRRENEELRRKKMAIGKGKR